jgi:hypothetical protein
MKAFFNKRSAKINIIRIPRFTRIRKVFLQCLFLVFMISPLVMDAGMQRRNKEVRKAEKMQEKKKKEAQRKYEKDVKRHMNNQSKETKAMMKKSKKQAKKNSPVKPARGKKCK